MNSTFPFICASHFFSFHFHFQPPPFLSYSFQTNFSPFSLSFWPWSCKHGHLVNVTTVSSPIDLVVVLSTFMRLKYRGLCPYVSLSFSSLIPVPWHQFLGPTLHFFTMWGVLLKPTGSENGLSKDLQDPAFVIKTYILLMHQAEHILS